MTKQQRAETFLKAKLFRLAAACNEEFETRHQLTDFEIVSRIAKHKVGNSNGIAANIPIFFAATFENAKGHTTLPIVIAFTPNATGKVAAALGQLAIGCRVTKRERVLMFLSVIDYLESIHELPNGSLQAHIERITAGGVQKDRAEIVAEYDEFSERAAKDLPYDDSLEVLAHLRYGDMAAA